MDSNSQGLVEYHNPYTDGRGMRHQGWKDSCDSMVHTDGTWVNSAYGVAPIEIQCQTVTSLRKAAVIYRDAYGDKKLADDLEARADRLSQFILENGYIQDIRGGYFAMGWERDSQGRLRRIETRSIDMHNVLRVLNMDNPAHKEMAFATVITLTSEDMFTRWGSRVMSAFEAAYGDYRYHCGIWPDKSNRKSESMSAIGLFGLDRFLGSRTTKLIKKVGCAEHIAGIDSAVPVIPYMDLYVFNHRYNELYLAEQMPPLYQTWGASSEIGKQERYTRIPTAALNADDRRFEQRLIADIAQRYR
jgi:hypothetical protein